VSFSDVSNFQATAASRVKRCASYQLIIELFSSKRASCDAQVPFTFQPQERHRSQISAQFVCGLCPYNWNLIPYAMRYSLLPFLRFCGCLEFNLLCSGSIVVESDTQYPQACAGQPSGKDRERTLTPESPASSRSWILLTRSDGSTALNTYCITSLVFWRPYTYPSPPTATQSSSWAIPNPFLPHLTGMMHLGQTSRMVR
jgi:hypothetical protein